MSSDTSADSQQPLANGGDDVKKARYVTLTGYGGLRMLKVQNEPEVRPSEGEILVRVRAWSVLYDVFWIEQNIGENLVDGREVYVLVEWTSKTWWCARVLLTTLQRRPSLSASSAQAKSRCLAITFRAFKCDKKDWCRCHEINITEQTWTVFRWEIALLPSLNTLPGLKWSSFQPDTALKCRQVLFSPPLHVHWSVWKFQAHQKHLFLATGMSFDDGAAFFMNYVTAYILLFDIGNVRSGHSILMHSIGGGVVRHKHDKYRRKIFTLTRQCSIISGTSGHPAVSEREGRRAVWNCFEWEAQLTEGPRHSCLRPLGRLLPRNQKVRKPRVNRVINMIDPVCIIQNFYHIP